MNDPNDPTRSGEYDPGTRTNTTFVPPADDQTRLAAELGSVPVPGFVIESILGRGAFGVVYKARQTGLNRVVALKMLIAGPYAGGAALSRFLLEAESVAQLEHPGIVRVFQFGNGSGHPYLAMEYIPGGTLSDRIRRDGPLPAADATKMVAKLAEAVAHAHSRGVVHRDIKPGNILLTTDGEPRLTDFGLAKVGRSDMTVTGQVLGTPAYMAPEQAAGKVREVGTASDVYALGAVLYDALTGRPPFAGDTAAVTLQKVLTEEPPRLRKLNAAIPRDLETICLKCLEKEPAKRYATAQALADDLLRYARNEPITVRPAGTLERGLKWVKRNKAATGAATAVALALVAGSAVSLGFGLEARRQAGEAQTQRQNAEDAAARERGEAERAESEKRNAIAARSELRQALVQAFLAPLVATDPKLELTPYERETFWRLAELRHNDVSWAFVEEAARSPLARDQLVNRAEYALHAVVGLDPKRRDEVDRLLLASVRSPVADRKALVLAQVAARWDSASQPLNAAAAQTLVAEMGKERDAVARSKLAFHLGSVTERMTPTEAARPLAAALGAEKDEKVRDLLIDGLTAVSERMDPTAAVAVLTAAAGSDEERFKLINAIAQAQSRVPPPTADALAAAWAKGTIAPSQYSSGLTAIAGRMEPQAAADLLLTALGQDVGLASGLVDGLTSAAARMEPAAAAKTLTAASDLLLKELRKKQNSSTRDQIVAPLSALAGAMEPTAAVAVLTGVLAQEKDTAARRTLCNWLTSVAGKIEPRAAAAALLGALRSEPDADHRSILVGSLVAATDRKPRTETAPILADAADILVAALKTGKDLRPVATGAIQTVVARMEPAAAAKASAATADVLLTAFNKETNAKSRQDLARRLAAIAEHMEPAAAATACATAADALAAAAGAEKEPTARGQWIDALVAVSQRMEPTAAAKILTAALAKETYFRGLHDLAAGVAAAAKRMPPPEAAQASAAAAAILAAALAQNPNGFVSKILADALVRVAEQMEPTAATKARAAATDTLLAMIKKGTGDGDDDYYLASGVVALTEPMGPAGARACQTAADTLTAALEKGKTGEDLGRSARAIALVAKRMERAVAIKTCAAAAEALTAGIPKVKNDTARDLNTLGDGITGLAEWAERDTAEKMRATAIGYFALALTKEGGDFNNRDNLSKAIAGAAEQMPPAAAIGALVAPLVPGEARHAPLLEALWSTAARMEPAAAVEVLTAALKRDATAEGRKVLAECLADAAGQLPPAAGARACGAAVDILTAALAKETKSAERTALSQGLVALTAHLDRGAAPVLLAALDSHDWLAATDTLSGLTPPPLPPQPAGFGGAKAFGFDGQPADLGGPTAGFDRSYFGSRRPTGGFGGYGSGFGGFGGSGGFGGALGGQNFNGGNSGPFGSGVTSSLHSVESSRSGLSMSLADAIRGNRSLADAQLAHATPSLATGSFAAPHGVLTAAALLHPSFHPQRRSLPPEVLVEMLKHPCCVGEVKWAVLDALELQYKRPFKDQWEFVEFAQKNHPHLDLLRPPKRPELKP